MPCQAHGHSHEEHVASCTSVSGSHDVSHDFCRSSCVAMPYKHIGTVTASHLLPVLLLPALASAPDATPGLLYLWQLSVTQSLHCRQRL